MQQMLTNWVLANKIFTNIVFTQDCKLQTTTLFTINKCVEENNSTTYKENNCLFKCIRLYDHNIHTMFV